MRAEVGRQLPACTAGGRNWPGLVLDVDATLVEVHSEKESAAAHFKGGFGFHPILVFLDNTNEALAGMLRPGNAGANTSLRAMPRAAVLVTGGGPKGAEKVPSRPCRPRAEHARTKQKPHRRQRHETTLRRQRTPLRRIGRC